MSHTQADATKEKLFDEFNSVVAETEALLKSVAGASSEKAGAMKASIEQGLEAAGVRLARIREASLDQARATAQATDEYVHDNPWSTIGIVAGLAAIAGLVAGLLIARR